MTAATPDTLIASSLRRNAATIAEGVAGISTLGLLTAGSLVSLLTGGLTIATVMSWLSGLGSNALASWIEQWARKHLAITIGEEPEVEQKLLIQLAPDLQESLATNDALAADVALVLQYVEAIPAVIDALHGRVEQQIQLLQWLLKDLRLHTIRNEQLHSATLQAVLVQGTRLLDGLSSAETRLRADIDAILAEATRLQTGSEHTYVGVEPASSSDQKPIVSRQEIADQQELLKAYNVPQNSDKKRR